MTFFMTFFCDIYFEVLQFIGGHVVVVKPVNESEIKYIETPSVLHGLWIFKFWRAKD